MADPADFSTVNWARNSTTPNLDGNAPFTLRPTVETIWTAIASVKFDNSDNLISFVDPHLFFSSAPATAKIHVSRPAGLNGSGSSSQVTIRTFSCTGDVATTAGVHYTSVDTVVSFADGETGVKSIDVQLLALNGAGLHLVGVEMVTPINCLVHHPRMYIHLDDGGVNAAATIATTALELEDSISGDITQLPGTQPIPCDAGTLTYLRAGTHARNYRRQGQDYGGINVGNSNGTQEAPVIASIYPGESPLIDQDNALTHDDAGNQVVTGFYLTNDSKFVWFMGFEITKTSYSGILSVGSSEGLVQSDGINIINCHIHDLANQDVGTVSPASNFDNIGGVRIDDSINLVVHNCLIHDIYDPQFVSNGIPSNVQPRGLHSGIHGYRKENYWYTNNTIYMVGRSIFHKDPNRLPTAPKNGGHMARNFFEFAEHENILISVAGGGTPGTKNNIIEHNVALNDSETDTDVCLVRFNYGSDTNVQALSLFMFNNTVIGGDWLFYAETVIEIVSYSNVLRDARGVIALEQNLNLDTSLQFSDNNMINALVGGGAKWLTNRNGASNSYADLSEWRDAFNIDNDPQLIRDMDENSIETAPTFVNEGADDYTTVEGNTIGAGNYGRDIGIEQELVGSTL